ncbi:E3 SUMO-protein ligase RanBP2-like [Hylaeus volcanicus]|uniref:E3 SUMO-protein ligase RanBP2-like n=1 Tax=Hylaeus volcanicus TaxID=313075 RepID=UPI0023B8700F|nr:E3 SUMO-protein ligase RanBP2-like [Hylaeus volcanicus]
MFRSKKDVDRHVKDIFIKLKSSEEKNLRCYNIAKLYYQVGDYESAKKYVSNYLEIRDKCAGAYKLLGQALEALKQKEAAFMQYKISLELEPKQDDLVLKVCELLTDMDVKMDVNIIKYWVERTDKKFPHHPIVFELKEKMLTQEKSDGSNDDLEKLITSELMVRQTDVHLQVKLLKHYLGNHRLEDAYNHAAGIEAKHSHRNSIDWYQSLSELLVECKPSKQSDWTFWIFYISVLERYAALCLKEQGNVDKNIADAMEAVFNFDQSLTEFKSRSISVHHDFIKNVLLHMWGQLNFHLACLFLRKTKRREDSWFEAGRLCTPLLLTALHVTPIDPTALWTTHLKNRLVKNLVHVWHREGSYRCSQAGHVLRDYARDNKKKLLDKIDKFCTNSWREHNYQKIFGKPYENRKATSYFSNAQVTNPPLRLCSYNELKKFDEISEEVWPNSLHHQVWLGLRSRHRNSHNKDNGPCPNQTSHVFSELQFSVFNLNQAAPDSLSRLDIDAFLNATIFCASAVIEEQQLSGFLDPDKFPTLPADLTNTLCTCAQEKWWSSAYKVYTMDKQKPLDEDLGEIRLELQRGLEVVRCIGNHGLHPVLLVHLARIFHYRAEALKEIDQENSDISSLEARYEMYWLNAIPLLERLQNNQTLRVTNTKFFNYQGPAMNYADLIKALEEGKLLMAQRFVRDKQHEKAIDALQALKCPEASFQQGKVYEMLADEIVSYMPKESLTSEIRSQHIVMLSKARECFYLTLDRLRTPGTNPKHPLNSELSTHISNIENKLKKIDPDLSRGNLSRNECSDGTSGDSYSSAHSITEVGVLYPSLTGINSSFSMVSTPQRTAHRKPKQYSTPYRAQHHDVDLLKNRSEARPSPERLDAQIRAINQTMNVKDNMILEQNKNILEKVEELAKEVKELTKEVGMLRKDMQRQRTQPDNVNPSLEEDLCVLSEEDYNDLHYNPNRVEPASSLPGNMFPTSHRHPYSQLVYPSTTAFQGYYPDGVFANPNAQPYSLYPPNVYPLPMLYPNARSKITENVLQQSLFTARLPTQMPDPMPQTNQSLQVLLQKADTPKAETTIKDAPVNKVPPVNVVITTSDTLPTTVPVVQPTLSVTIPPHFRLGSISTSAVIEQPPFPHSYQIPMPSQATIPTTVNLPPLASTLTTMPANISVTETPMTDNTNVCSTGSPNSSDHEHDPIPDFVPVIPLPAEVKVTTGEEGQETLFCARAKLFRFVGNEWKERGIGNVKLLRNEEGKIRLLMRREQVLKVCANHYLSPDMELTAKSNNEKTWFWVAHDFADGELKVEKFCIKFKTVEEGASFKEHFEKAKASLAQLSDKSTNGAGKATVKPSSPVNNVQKKEVKFVEQTSQKQPTDATTISETSSEKSKANPAATVVGGFSFTSTPIIQKVATPEPTTTPSKPEASPFAGFMFIKTMTTAESSTTTTLKNSQTSTFAFAKTTTPQEEATSGSVPMNVSQSSLRRPHAPPVCATAVVGIDDFSATTEHEEVLFEDKISLQYYVNDKQWDNRGTGQMKVLWNSKTGRIRLLMIEENSSKVCYNFNVSAKMPLTFKSGSSTVVSWTIQYGVDNKTGTFAATFKTSTQASQFHSTLTNNQQKMVKDCVSAESLKKQEKTKNVQKSKTQASLSEMFKPPSGSWECNACYTRNGASDAKCIACETPNPSARSKGSTPATTTSNQMPLSEMFKTPADSWKCKCCEIVNSRGNNYCVACDTPKCPSIPPKPKTDGFLVGTPTSGATPTFTFGIPQDATKKSNAGFTFQKPADTSTDSKSDAKADASKFTFVMPQRSGTPPNKGTPFTFDSPGKSFGFYFRGVSPTKSPGGGENSEEEVVESDDIHFSPIIPLPDKIEVKTGEEDEEVLYLHRAKLFRFDKETGEWKERGLGDIKLLRHNQTGKLRLIMRREQILKLCLNHFILPGLDMTLKDEKTWMWNAADYSEGEIEHTLFACRFKNSDIARNFKNAIDEARSAKSVPAGETKTEAKTEELAKAKPAKDIEVLYEMKVTTEEKDAAMKLQLPENFYAYKQKPDCPGCRGCKEPTAPLFKDENSVTTASVPKICTESCKPTTFSSKTESTNATASNVSTTDTSTQNTTSSISKPGLHGTTIAQSTMNSFSMATPTISFGNSDSKTSSDKKASFSFVMPQSQATEQNIVATENLKICSPIVSQGQAMSTTSSPFKASASSTTSAGSIFAMADNPFSLSTGKSIFGGSSKKDTPGIIKPSSFNVSANSSESPFLNNFNSQLKTTTSATTIFGTSAPIFGSSAMKTSSETTSSDTSTFATNTTTTSLFGGSGKSTNSVFDNTSTPFTFNLAFDGRTNESPFGISNSTATNTAETKTASSENESQKDSGISFFPSADVSFSALAAAAPQQAFKSDPNFSFSGAGSTVFGSKSSAVAAKSAQKTKEGTQDKKGEHEEEENAENETEQDHDPYFEPIVPLPDVIEVRTGEEDEEKVFCERAKLYRFNAETREWKERGVGEMKILHHTKQGTYRLLLRRDQVHKVVCNLLLTPDIKFSRLITSDRAWIWAGMNYAEEQPCVEELAVRFKNTELAEKFKDTVNEIQHKLREIREKVTESNPIVEEPEEEENEEEENEDADEIEDEEDEDYIHSLRIFEKRATLFARTDADAKWELVALGNLIIYHDSDTFAGSIILKADETNEIVSNTVICTDIKMQVNKQECVWTAIDRALKTPTKRTLKAIFSSVQAAQEMYDLFQDVSVSRCK